MFDNKEIESKGGNYLNVGSHKVYVFDIETEKTFVNKDGETREKVTVMFKNEQGEIHYEDFLIMDSTMWRLKLLSIACGIGEEAQWDWGDLQAKQLVIHLKSTSYTDKYGEKRMKSEAYKFEPYKGTDVYSQNGPVESDPF